MIKVFFDYNRKLLCLFLITIEIGYVFFDFDKAVRPFSSAFRPFIERKNTDCLIPFVCNVNYLSLVTNTLDYFILSNRFFLYLPFVKCLINNFPRIINHEQGNVYQTLIFLEIAKGKPDTESWCVFFFVISQAFAPDIFIRFYLNRNDLVPVLNKEINLCFVS